MKRVLMLVVGSFVMMACGPGAKIDGKQGAAEAMFAASQPTKAKADPSSTPVDVTGGWRTKDENGNEIDSSATTANGVALDGITGLRKLLLDEPTQFPRTITQKLMAYALGRRLEYFDEPTVRRIVREAAPTGYRWSSLIQGIVKSPAFRLRAAPAQPAMASQ